MMLVSSRRTRVSPPPCRLRSLFRPHLEALEDRCLLSVLPTAGTPDPTFGSGAGYITTSTSATADPYGNAVVIQPDGKLVAAGSGGSSGFFTASRYSPAGALDTTFGSSGIVTVSFFRNGGPVQLGGVALDSSGRIVLAGTAYGAKKQNYLALARFTSSGSLDTTFGNKGTILTPVNGSELDAVVIQPNGEILAAGWGTVSNTASLGLLARYNANGSLDTSFGSGGLVETYLGAGQAVFHALALQTDGRILAGGLESATPTGAALGPFAVARFNSSGSLDTTFGSGGVVTTSIAGNANAIWETGVHGLLVQGNGMIVAAGTVSNGTRGEEVALTRYDTFGNLDPAFGNGGIALTPSTGITIDAAVGAALQGDGKIVVAGYHGGSTVNSFEVERYTSAGALDTTFNGTGIVTTAIGSESEAAGVTIYPSTDPTGNAGKIVVVGSTYNGSTWNIALARYLPSEPEIGSFTADPNPVTAGSSTTLTASNITDGNPNSTITQVAFYVQVNGTSTLLGYGTQSSPGVWSFGYTASLAPGTYTLFAQAEDSYGVFGDPFALSLQVT